MTSNSAEMVQQGQPDCQNLLGYMRGPNARAQTASTVALTRFRRLLALGAARLRLCFVTRAAVRPAEPFSAPDGTRLTYHDQRSTTHDAVFGKRRFWRHAFTAPGQKGRCALDTELSLPAPGYADLRCEWAVEGTTAESSRERQTGRERLLGLSLSRQAIDTSVADAAGDVTAFDTQPVEPTTRPTAGAIWVVPADGQGGPMVQSSPATPPVRRGQGPKHTTKQEAVVTSLSIPGPPIHVSPRQWGRPYDQRMTTRPPPRDRHRRTKRCVRPSKGRRWR